MMNELKIREYEGLLYSSMLSDNVEMLDELIDRDLLFVTHNNQIINKEDELNSHRMHALKLEHVEVKEMKVKQLDPIALVVSKVEMKGLTTGGEVIDGEYCYTRVWKNQDGKLKVIFGHCSQEK